MGKDDPEYPARFQTMCSHRSDCCRAKQIAALLCVATYLLGATELLPQLLALGASIEGSHTVYLGRGHEKLQIILKHESGRNLGSSATAGQPNSTILHRHGGASRLFCLFAESTQARSDHIAYFSVSSLCENRGESVKTTGKNLLGICFGLVLSAPAYHKGDPWRSFSRRFLFKTPLQSSSSLLSSTVLLI